MALPILNLTMILSTTLLAGDKVKGENPKYYFLEPAGHMYTCSKVYL